MKKSSAGSTVKKKTRPASLGGAELIKKPHAVGERKVVHGFVVSVVSESFYVHGTGPTGRRALTLV